jgi:hypothetical protein
MRASCFAIRASPSRMWRRATSNSVSASWDAQPPVHPHTPSCQRPREDPLPRRESPTPRPRHAGFAHQIRAGLLCPL